MKRKDRTSMKREKYSVFNLKILCTVALLCAVFAANAQTRYYWVGAGDGYTWANIMNWSATSGGNGGAAGNITQAPTSGNTVVFDENSTVAAGRNITISGSVQCDSLIVESDAAMTTGFTNATLTINGSLLIKKTGLTWNGGTLYFASSRADETIQTSGTVFSGNGRYFSSNASGDIYFSGSGSWLLADDFTTGTQIHLQSGSLDLNGKNLSVHSVNTTGGKISFPNSTITCSYRWNYGSTSPPLTADETKGSLIRVVASGFSTGDKTDRYNNVEFTGATYNHTISSGLFNKITFLKGSGIVGNTSVDNLVTDSLIILTTDHYNFSNITVNDYFEAHPQECGGQLRLFQSDASKGGIKLGGSATTDIERAVIQDLKISGAPVEAKKSYSWGRNEGWTFTAPDDGTDMYWIGGGGKWNEPDHWSFSSGGPLAGCIPTLADNVIFDDNSGTIGSGASAVMLDGDAWCHNMTWDGVAGTPYFNLCGLATDVTPDYNTVNYLMIGGSMQLQSTLTVNQYQTSAPYGGSNNCIYFVSDSDERIITNNAVKVAADIYFQSVSGTGKWTLNGDLNLFLTNDPASFFGRYRHYIYLNRGHLDISGQKIIAYSFLGESDASNPTGCFSDRLSSRTLNMAKAVIDLTANWYYHGGQPLAANQSAGSSVLCGVGDQTPNIRTKANDHYYNVELRTARTGSTGTIYSNNTGETFFNKVTVSAPVVTINSTGANSGVIRPDSLLFTGNGTYTIDRDFTINKYLSTSVGCGGNTTLTATAARTITLGEEPANQEQVNVSNTHLNNISITPYPKEDGYKVTDCTFEGTTSGWNNEDLPQRILYWVGGAGNWSDGAHWSTVSGLYGGAYGNENTGCVPRQIDDVIFDDGSFSDVGQIVTIDANAYCHDMRWVGTDVAMKPELRSPIGMHLYISGSLELQAGMVFKKDIKSYLYLHIHFISDDPEGETITSNGVTINYSHLYFENEMGKWTFKDNVHISSSGDITTLFHFVSGTLDLSDKTITMTHTGFVTTPFSGSSPNKSTRTLIMTNAIINLGSSWSYTGNLEAENSTINHTNSGSFTAEADARYHNYNYNSTSNSTGNYYLRGGIWNRLNINYSHRLDGVVTDTLSLSANSSYKYWFQNTTQVNKAFYGNGTPCNTIYLQSYEETKPATLDIKKEAANMPNDILLVDYAYIHGLRPLTGEDNASLHKGSHSPDVDKSGTAWGYGKGANNYNNKDNNNDNIGGENSWAIMDDFDEDDSSPFGEENRMVGCHLFPYQLTSANFSPTAEALFKWFKCDYATLDAAFKSVSGTNAQKFEGLDTKLGAPESTDPEFWIDGSEFATTYSLIVDYGNGCVAYDDITITMVAFAGCGSIETCVGHPVEKYFPPTELLSTVPNPTEVFWVMEDEEGELTGEDGAKYSMITPSELIMEAAYDGKNLIYYSRNEDSDRVLWADTLTFKLIDDCLNVADDASNVKPNESVAVDVLDNDVLLYEDGNPILPDEVVIHGGDGAIPGSEPKAPDHGTVTLDRDTGGNPIIVYTPNTPDAGGEPWQGIDEFEYEVWYKDPDYPNNPALGIREGANVYMLVLQDEYEVCDDEKVIDLTTILAGADFSWDTSGADGNATVDGDRILTVNRPEDGQSQTVTLSLTVDYDPEGTGSSVFSDPFTVTVRFAPSVMIWLGASADWNTPSNWYPAGVPQSCTDVYIPGMSVEGNDTYYFPSLTGSQADNVCDRIFFLPGAQLGRPDLLTYAEAHVEIDYGKGSLAQQAGLAYTAFVALGKERITSQDRVKFAAQYSNSDIALQRGRWNMLSAPLKEIVTGDFAFGGFPFSFIQQFDAESGSDSYIKGSWAAFKSETDFELKPGQGFGHFYYDYMNNTPYGMDNSAGSQWDNAKTYSSLTAEAPAHKDGSSAFGLAQQNGILHFPYFADDDLSAARRVHEYSGTKTSGTSTFHFVYQSPLKSTLFLQFTGDKEEVVRTEDAYKFITDGGAFNYGAGNPGASKLALVGNPYMSALDFDAFYAANADKIKNGYQIYAKAPQSTGDTYAEYDGQTGDRYIAPMQSFLVETTTGFSEELSLAFNPEMAVTNTGTKLRASRAITDRLTIAASNANGRTNATVRWLEDAEDGFCNRDISKIIDNADNLPRVYTLAGMENGKLRALSVNSIQSNRVVVPVGVTSSYKGEVTFTISGMDAYDADISFVDAVTGARQDISGQGEFTYTYTHNGDKASVEDRFYLHFSKASTGTEDIVATRLNAYAQQTDLIILAPDGNPAERVTVYDIQGRLLSEHTLSGSSPYRVENAFGEQGIYAVKIHTNQAVYSIKVIR